jgi:hypothetical protein
MTMPAQLMPRRPVTVGRRAAASHRGEEPLRSTVAAAACLAAGYAALQWAGRTYGSTRAERACGLPGDDLVREPQVVITHAVSIPAPASEVWPWLVQVGWHRGGWYTSRWVDRLLFPANAPSASRVVPELQHLAVGDLVPDGPPETQCVFRVVALEPRSHLVLRSDSHLPLAWRRTGRAAVDWTWTFVLRPTDDGAGTRLLFRWRARTRPGWLTAACVALVVPADGVMARQMLRGLRARAYAGSGTFAPASGARLS